MMNGAYKDEDDALDHPALIGLQDIVDAIDRIRITVAGQAVMLKEQARRIEDLEAAVAELKQRETPL